MSEMMNNTPIKPMTLRWKWEDALRERYGYIEYKSNKSKKRKRKRNYGVKSRRVWVKYWRQEIPKGYEIHHVNGKSYDIRISNLALVTIENHKIIHHRRKMKEKNKRLSMGIISRRKRRDQDV